MYAQGPHVTYEKIFSSFFNVFKIFVTIFVHNENLLESWRPPSRPVARGGGAVGA